jgi:hypothetical protein
VLLAQYENDFVPQVTDSRDSSLGPPNKTQGVSGFSKRAGSRH